VTANQTKSSKNNS